MEDGNLKAFNFTACCTMLGLGLWALIGDEVSKPLENISIFEKLDLFEIRDRLSPGIIIGIVLAILVSIALAKFEFTRGELVTSGLVTIGFLFSISSYLIDDDVAWAGLGVRVVVGCIVAAAIAIGLQNKIHFLLDWSTKNRSFITGTCLLAFLAVYLPSITQFSGGIIDLFASSTVFNELLLPVTGITPLGDFATQYTSMLGWPLLALKSFSASIIMPAVLTWLFLLTLIQVWTFAQIGKTVFKKIPSSVLLLYASSLILMKGSKQGDIAGSIVGSFFSIPSRTLFPTFICLVLSTSFFSTSEKMRRFVFLGFLLPVTALNNLEFGLTGVIAAGIVLILLWTRKSLNLSTWFLIIGSALTTLLTIAIIFAVRSAPLNFGLWTAMVRAQGSGGYMNSPMPVMGSYLLVFAILAGGLVLGITNLYRSKDDNISRSAVIATYASSWGILSMPYYTGRSWPSHIHVFFIPLTLCIFGIAGIFYYSGFFSAQKLSIRQICLRIPILLILVLPLGTFLIAPNPIVEWSRATGGGSEWSLESQTQTKVVRSVVDALNRWEISKDDAVYFGDQYASTVELITGVRNGLGVNTLEYSLVSDGLREVACSRLPKLNPNFVISQNDDTRSNFVGPSLMDSSCPGMTVLYAPDDIGVTIFTYEKPSD